MTWPSLQAKQKRIQTMSHEKIPVSLEMGKKKIFAVALAWPGWTRAGRDAKSAIAELLASAPRYARVLHAAGIDFTPPAEVAAFSVVERIEGSPATDFGAPSAIPAADADTVDETELERLQAILGACWNALDAAIEAAAGKELRKGPRGGGREAEEILRHVNDAQNGYLSRIGAKSSSASSAQFRAEVLQALAASARGEVAAEGPRGGARWPARYFTRRAAWHILDHAWEIEDRIE
jgi:hypothetical protein